VLLMTPGPIAIDPRVIAAVNRPAITPEHPLFMEVLDDVFQKLRAIFRTESWVTALPGSGRMGLEAAIVSVLEPGDHSVHLVNGAFGELAVDIARRAGANVTVVQGPWGGPLDLEAFERAVRQARPKLVTLVHSETSTGALYDPIQVGRISRQYGALFMVDAISSVGNMRFEMDAIDCDLAVAASNKGVGSLHGLAMVGVSPRALQAMNARQTPCSSWSLDLQRWNDMYFSKSSGRRSATPPPTHLVFALQEACRLLLEEGLEAHWSRCHRFAEATRQAVQAAGLKIFPNPNLLGDCVTAVCVPDQLEGPAILRSMEANGVLIAGTVARPSPITGKVLRISHQGIQASVEMLLPTVAALECTLRTFDYAVEYGTMAAAFERSLER
jgi:alanine-glyoxylate transaminase / serine-glyoxylate transaminase / serine-pyruvate transaminase